MNVNKIYYKFILCILGLGFISSNLPVKPSSNSNATIKELSFHKLSGLENVKQNLEQETSDFKTAYKKLIQVANQCLKEGPFSVTQKSTTPPSGDKRDYYSLGPYWWPDQSKSEGLPWVLKDGQINPKTRGQHVDIGVKNQFLKNVEILTWAYFFSEKLIYKEKLIELLDTWLINEESRMNPNLNYAQGIPGICSGRGIGIIEFTGIIKVLTAIEVLELRKAIGGDRSSSYRSWCSEFRSWLYDSQYGMDERNKENNHGTWYDVEYVGLSIFLGKDLEAKKHINIFTKSRIESQFEVSGAQKHELTRTKSLSYSTMNLKAFLTLCKFSDYLGIDLFNYESKSGKSIKSALQFLEPYANNELDWPYQQISDVYVAKSKLIDVLQGANRKYKYSDRLLEENINRKKLWKFLLEES